MMDEMRYAVAYVVLIVGLLAELLLAMNEVALGSLAMAAILTIAALQALFIFFVYMQGRYGPRPILYFTVISLLAVVPLFIALLFSVSMPHHGSLP